MRRGHDGEVKAETVIKIKHLRKAQYKEMKKNLCM